MIKKLKKFVTSLAIFSMVGAPVLVSATALAATTIEEGLDKGTCLSVSGTSPECPSGASAESRVNEIIRLVINIFSLLVGVISVVMIIIGGLKYITSGGESANVTGAKNTILYAIVGLVIVALAQIIVRFVLERTASTTG